MHSGAVAAGRWRPSDDVRDGGGASFPTIQVLDKPEEVVALDVLPAPLISPQNSFVEHHNQNSKPFR